MPKPCFGCITCRQRRVKCDERNGGCLRCERYRIACPGYQDPFDVVLRQKGTWETVSEALQHPYSVNRSADYATHHIEQCSAKDSGEPRPTTLAYPLFLVRQLSVDPEQATLGAYYASYCVSSSTLCSLEYMREQGNGCLLAAIKMLGTMQLHQIWQLPEGSDALVRQYTEAIALLNAALASPMESQEDSTLLATLLLSVVEMKISPDFTLHYWQEHTKGAAALLELRGADQVRTRLGSALFFQVSSQVVVYCILGRRHIPAELKNLRPEIQRHVIDENHPLWQWHGLMYRFVDFLAANSGLDAEGMIQDACAVIAEALRIHHEIKNIFQSVGSYWQFDTQRSEEFSSLITYEHVYPSLLTVRVWNERRSAEILLFATILQAAAHSSAQAPFDKELQLYMNDAHESINHAALETLAGVPQMIAGLKGKSSLHTTSTSAQGLQLCHSNSEYDENVFQQLRQDSSVLPYMDSCRVQWPIYFAVQCEYVEPRIRIALLQVLEDAGKILKMWNRICCLIYLRIKKKWLYIWPHKCPSNKRTRQEPFTH